MEERFIAFVEPERIGIIDTKTKEIIYGTSKEVQTTPEEIVNLQMKARKINNND